jgi:hypothetical protein
MADRCRRRTSETCRLRIYVWTCWQWAWNDTYHSSISMQMELSCPMRFILLIYLRNRQGKRIFSMAARLALLSSECQSSFPGGKATGGAELTTHLRVVVKLRIRGSVSLLFRTSWGRDAQLSTGTTAPSLPFASGGWRIRTICFNSLLCTFWKKKRK